MHRIVVIALLAASAPACKKADPPPITAEWIDTFERDHLGGDYHATTEAYKLADGALNVKGAKNRPVWLRKKLPRDAVIELDAWSNSAAGDIKIEAWGDGESYDPDEGAYMATGYVFIFGGWGNSRSIIARQDEHAPDVPVRTTPRVQPTRKYHFKIVRKGNKIDWYVDDMATPFLSMDDPSPLQGPGHEYFGFNNWESDTWFDNLKIQPLP